MLRTDLVTKIGLIDEKLICGEDIYFYFIASYDADLYWVEKPCLYFRRYHESMIKDIFCLRNESPRYARRLPSDPRLRMIHRQLRWQHAAALRQLSMISLVHNYRLRALWAAMAAMFWTPSDRNGFWTPFKAYFGKAGLSS